MKNFTIKHFESLLEEPVLGEFVKKHHYLKSLSRGNKHCFAMYYNDKLVGVAAFGIPVGKNVNKKYGNVLELKRMVLNRKIKNGCSFFLGHCLRWLKTNTQYTGVISYADPEQGHQGIIYKASNFKYIGKQSFRTPFISYQGKKIYARNLYNGSKRGNFLLNKKRKNNESVKIQYAKPKLIFMYNFN